MRLERQGGGLYTGIFTKKSLGSITMYINIEAVRQASVYRWPVALKNLGVELTYNKHSACPACGGVDRFRFDDKEGRGTFYCNNCGSGDGLNLVMNINNCDAREAAILVQGALGGNVSQLPVMQARHIDYSKQHQLARRKARSIWFKHTERIPLNNPYIIAKGILPIEALLYADMIVVPYISAKNGLETLQFINLDKKMFLKGSSIKGAYCPIGEPTSKVIVATGYATSISIHMATGLMVLCCASDSSLSDVVGDAVTNGLDACVGGDNDHPTSKPDKKDNKNSGIKAAIKAARKHKVMAFVPPEIVDVSDFNDLHKLNGLISVRNCFSPFIGVTA